MQLCTSVIGSALLLLLLTAQAASQCPPGTAELSSADSSSATKWCLRAHGTNASFCDAVRACHALGEEMVTRQVYLALRNSGWSRPASSFCYWVGLTDALHERSSSKVGWVWMSDGQVTATDDGHFADGEPNNLQANEDCVCGNGGGLWDTACSDMLGFYCFSKASSPPPSNSATGVLGFFAKTPVVSFVQPDPGCWLNESSSSVASTMDCAARCFALPAGDCVGFYWNSARLECLILPYFDAAVPLGFASHWEKRQWEKFIRIIAP